MKLHAFIVMLIAAAITVAACSNSGESSDPVTPPVDPNLLVDLGTSPGAPVVNIPPGTVYTPPTTGPGYGPGLSYAYGGTASFSFDSTTVYNQYVYGLRTIPDLSLLSNVVINLNLDRVITSGKTSYGGTITIGYLLYGQTYQGFFTSGNDASSTKYNVWFNPTGSTTPVWHAFFEDFMGGLIVVIDGTLNLADGYQITDTVSGSVWFKNFGTTSTPHPDTYCWFLIGGSYDCRAWKTLWGVDTTAAVYPGSHYTRLGTFQNMPLNAAFNGNVF